MDNWALPTINLDRCTACGLCITYCPTKAVEMVESLPAIVRAQDCAYCGACEDICPESAIELVYEIAPINKSSVDNESG